MATPVAFDPDNTRSITDFLKAALAGRFSGVTVQDPLRRFGNGLDSYIYAFQLAGDAPDEWLRPLILRVYTSPSHAPKAQRECDIQSWVSGRGFPAPRPLLLDISADFLGRPFMIMERMPGVPLLEKMRNPLALRAVIRKMAALQVRLHRLSPEGCPLTVDPPLIERGFAELRATIDRYGSSGISDALAWLEAEQGRVTGGELAVTHNDFHPLNLLMDGRGDLSLVDWSDAALGDRNCDVARTLAIFSLAPLLVTGIERVVLSVLRPYILRIYRRAYTSALTLDEVRLRYWQAYHAALGMAQVMIAGDPSAAEAGVRQDLSLSPRLAPGLRRYFESLTR